MLAVAASPSRPRSPRAPVVSRCSETQAQAQLSSAMKQADEAIALVRLPAVPRSMHTSVCSQPMECKGFQRDFKGISRISSSRPAETPEPFEAGSRGTSTAARTVASSLDNGLQLDASRHVHPCGCRPAGCARSRATFADEALKRPRGNQARGSTSRSKVIICIGFVFLHTVERAGPAQAMVAARSRNSATSPASFAIIWNSL